MKMPYFQEKGALNDSTVEKDEWTFAPDEHGRSRVILRCGGEGRQVD